MIKVVTINDGQEEEIQNGNYLYVEELPRTAEILEGFLEDGWKILYAMKEYNPSIRKEGAYSFYKGGITFILEKD